MAPKYVLSGQATDLLRLLCALSNDPRIDLVRALKGPVWLRASPHVPGSTCMPCRYGGERLPARKAHTDAVASCMVLSGVYGGSCHNRMHEFHHALRGKAHTPPARAHITRGVDLPVNAQQLLPPAAPCLGGPCMPPRPPPPTHTHPQAHRPMPCGTQRTRLPATPACIDPHDARIAARFAMQAQGCGAA